MNTTTQPSPEQWASQWLDAVAASTLTMSQRSLSSVIERGGGLETIQRLAQQKGVHLLLLEDDKGAQLVAASIKTFRVLC